METLFTIAFAIWWRSHRKFVASQEDHWFKAFAAERGHVPQWTPG
jgi:hypothetical protein